MLRDRPSVYLIVNHLREVENCGMSIPQGKVPLLRLLPILPLRDEKHGRGHDTSLSFQLSSQNENFGVAIGLFRKEWRRRLRFRFPQPT
jgi:hypothetical protein